LFMYNVQLYPDVVSFIEPEPKTNVGTTNVNAVDDDIVTDAFPDALAVAYPVRLNEFILRRVPVMDTTIATTTSHANVLLENSIFFSPFLN
jgi:hypothetical protein